jgi:3-methylfumaryl-CoA hydratase
MWAGSRLAFHDPIGIGDRLRRRSVISSIRRKEGSAGPLIFVTVRYEIGREGQPAAIVDEHDIVYRGLQAPAVRASLQNAELGACRRELVLDTVQLFRYSALTFNGHRIHYDRDYVMREEGYPGLVVLGPLIATLLLDLLRLNAPRLRISAFSFHAVSPLFDAGVMTVNATPPGADGIVRLWAAKARDELAMTAEARLA